MCIRDRGSDGRELYYRSEGLNPACWNNATGAAITNGACATPTGQSRARALSNPGFSNVLLADKTNKGGGDSLTVGISQPTSAGFGWSLAYTRTTAKDCLLYTSRCV